MSPDSFDEQDLIFRRLARMMETGEEGVLATVISTRLSTPRQAGAKLIVHRDGSLTGTIGGGSAEALVIATASEVMADRECRQVPIDLAGEHGVCGGTMQIFLEPIQRSVPFFVIGAGHVGRAVAELGRGLRFRFTLIDDRPEMAKAAATLPGVTALTAGPDELAACLEIPAQAAVLVCSRNHLLDGAYLEALLRLELAAGREFVFFGSLGSRAKAARLRQALASSADLAPRLARVRLPVGIAIGAESPAEIALSILAEAHAVLRGVTPVTLPDGGLAYRVQGARP